MTQDVVHMMCLSESLSQADTSIATETHILYLSPSASHTIQILQIAR